MGDWVQTVAVLLAILLALALVLVTVWVVGADLWRTWRAGRARRRWRGH